MKKFALSFFLFALIFTSCKKEASPSETDEPVENNPELVSTKDISLAMVNVSDLMVLCAMFDEKLSWQDYYPFNAIAGTPSNNSGTITITRNLDDKSYMIAFNKVKGNDGKIRSGSIYLDAGYQPIYIPNPDTSLKSPRIPGYIATVIFIEFEVDNWKITTEPGKPLVFRNILNDKNYNPANTNLAWSLSGKIFLTNTDSTRNITWDGTTVQTLANTSSIANSKTSPINWSQAVLQYTGLISGNTSSTVPYVFTMNTDAPITRDFNCSISNPALSGANAYHPLVYGTPMFKTSNLAMRYINYNSQNSNTYPCDNKARVMVTNLPYEVDLNY